MEFVTHKTYYDASTGKSRRITTFDGRILQNKGCPKHPVWAVGSRVSLLDLKTDTESYISQGAHIKGKIFANKPVYATWITLSVYGNEYSGSPALRPLMNAFGLDTGDYKVIRDFIENFTEYFKNKKVEISGILQLSKSGQQKLEDGCILLATHQGGLYTLEDIEVKIV